MASLQLKGVGGVTLEECTESHDKKKTLDKGSASWHNELKELATKPDDLGLNPKTHIVEAKDRLLQLVPRPHVTHAYSHTQREINVRENRACRM